MKTLKSDSGETHEEEKAAEESKSEAAPEQTGFFIPNDKIDFSGLKIERMFADYVDFDTFSKSNFHVVKVNGVRLCQKPKKLLKFAQDDGTGTNRMPFCMKTAVIEAGKPLIPV